MLINSLQYDRWQKGYIHLELNYRYLSLLETVNIENCLSLLRNAYWYVGVFHKIGYNMKSIWDINSHFCIFYLYIYKTQFLYLSTFNFQIADLIFMRLSVHVSLQLFPSFLSYNNILSE